MNFTIVPVGYGDEPDHAILSGIAHGLSELFPVPQHPGDVLRWLGSPAPDQTGLPMPPPQRDPPPHRMLDDA